MILKEPRKQENKFQETKVGIFEMRMSVYFLDGS